MTNISDNVMDNRNTCRNDAGPTVRNVEVNEDEKQTIMKFGDSHFAGCTLKINSYCNMNFVTTGFVKPGTDNFALTTTIRKTTQKPTDKYEIVFWGSTISISKNNAKNGLSQVVNFVRDNRHTNILLVTVSPRYDLTEWSCVNKEVQNYKRKLSKFINNQEHVNINKIRF